MKITSSLTRGGPELTLQALSEASGIVFDGYLLTGFEGFTGLIEVLGGLEIDVPVDLADRWAGAYIDAGEQTLSPADALAFARVRKTISGGDFTRKYHGGLALIAAATMVKTMGAEAIPGLLESSAGLYWTDLNHEETLLLVASIVWADVASATNVVADGYVDTTSGGASIVRLTDSAYALFEDMQDGELENS
jgi:LCP family protein required for cell wall assembly